VTEGQDATLAQPAAVVEPTSIEEKGWYLYGITRHNPASDRASEPRDSGTAGISGTQIVDLGEVAAIVRPVLLADFTPETVSERAGNPVWLEEMARGHNDVIAAVHQQQTILPAKFGSVYASLGDLKAGLEPMEDMLRAQLARLDGADEWAVHVFAERPNVAERVAAEDPRIQDLQRELESARPGRAYFLRRQIADELEAATDVALANLAQAAFDQLSTYARASQVDAVNRSRDDESRMEVLKAAFLVARTDADTFLQGIGSLAENQDGMDAEYTGPWPPYSFARFDQEGSQ
jgi:Gas vesicle synthesis protein GvpL/GvpF